MAWLEAATNYLATLSYKLIRGDSGEGGRRRREETHHNSYGTEWNSQQYPSGSQNFDFVYGHGGEYYGQGGGSEKHYYSGNPPQEQQRYSFHIRDQNSESEVNVVRSQRVEKKGGWRPLCRRRIDYEESGMITKQYVDSSGKPVVEQTPYRSRMYEENQYIPFGDEEGTMMTMNAAASVPREVAERKRKKKRWSIL